MRLASSAPRCGILCDCDHFGKARRVSRAQSAARIVNEFEFAGYLRRARAGGPRRHRLQFLPTPRSFSRQLRPMKDEDIRRRSFASAGYFTEEMSANPVMTVNGLLPK